MQECVKCSSSCLTTWLDSAWRRRGARRWRAQALRRLQRWARLLCPVLLSCKPIIFSREQMSIYVRVKELWAFGVAHKLAVIIMILASPANCRKKGPASRVRPTSQARPRPDISIQASTFLKTRRQTYPDLRAQLPACLTRLPPISPNFLAENWCCNFPSLRLRSHGDNY